MDDIIRIIKSLKKSGILIDRAGYILKHKIKRQQGGFLCMLLGTLGASMFAKYFDWKRSHES